MKSKGGGIGTILKRLAIGLALVAVIGGSGYYGYRYWTVGRFVESTDDAYLEADYTTIAPKVSGYIAAVLVDDNERVDAGQMLARIDDRDFVTGLAEATSNVATAEDEIKNLEAQIQLQHSIIAQSEADIRAAEAALVFSSADSNRYRTLARTGFGTVQRAQQAEADFREKTAAKAHSRAVLVAAQQQIVVLQTAQAKARSQLIFARSAQHQAELNLSYTRIVSPIKGTVGARSLRVGEYVQAGTQLMAIVPLHAVYVVGNFKETQLTYVRPGAPATIEVDSFPGTTFTGRVDSLAPASGLEFSLLPPDNATGNFTKIVQRVPVKIVFNERGPLAGLLRPGMSVEASIDTKAMQLSLGTDALRLSDDEASTSRVH